MTSYAVALAFLLVAVASIGLWPLATGIALAELLSGSALLSSYRRRLDSVSAPRHRERLDRLVQWQWAASAGLGLSAAVGIGASGVHVAEGGAVVRVAQAVVCGAAVALTAVFVSSLVDWYWVLPRVGGLGPHPAPCEAPGERWKYLTEIWLFHRGVATAIVVASVAAVPFYLAATLGGAVTKAVLGVIGVVFGGALAAINQRGLASLANAFNQSVYVGDTVLVNQAGETEGAVTVRRRAYVEDVSVQGLKYQLLRGDKYSGAQFARRGHGPILGGDDYRAIERVEGPAAVPCQKGCSGANWYCRCNQRAYDF